MEFSYWFEIFPFSLIKIFKEDLSVVLTVVVCFIYRFSAGKVYNIRVWII